MEDTICPSTLAEHEYEWDYTPAGVLICLCIECHQKAPKDEGFEGW